MALTIQQYNVLERLHRSEELSTKKAGKVNVTSLYLQQANQIIGYLSSFEAETFRSKSEATRMLARLDLLIDTYKEPITEVIESAEDTLIVLNAKQATDTVKAANYTFSFGTEFVAKTKKVIIDKRHYEKGFWYLSDSVWGEQKKGELYAEVLKGINTGQPKKELISKLEDRLTKQGQGGQYHKVQRVLDTEFNNVYNIGKLESTRAWNAENQDKILFGRKVSSAHKVSDICDEIAGVYAAEKDVPANPHPNCRCISFQVFASDYTDKIKKIKSTGGFFKSTNYKGQQTQLLSTKSGVTNKVPTSAALDKITNIKDPALRKELMQKLQNEVRKDDPYYNTVKTFARLYG